MPFPTNAIHGRTNPEKRRQRIAREAKAELANLPDWMFWNREKRETYFENEVRTSADSYNILMDVCEFVRLAICLMGYYEERNKEGE